MRYIYFTSSQFTEVWRRYVANKIRRTYERTKSESAELRDRMRKVQSGQQLVQAILTLDNLQLLKVWIQNAPHQTQRTYKMRRPEGAILKGGIRAGLEWAPRNAHRIFLKTCSFLKCATNMYQTRRKKVWLKNSKRSQMDGKTSKECSEPDWLAPDSCINKTLYNS